MYLITIAATTFSKTNIESFFNRPPKDINPLFKQPFLVGTPRSSGKRRDWPLESANHGSTSLTLPYFISL